MAYDLEADWHLLDTCNYRCGYCFFGPDILGAKLRTFAEPADWKRAFDATGATWLIHMTGGEPSLYPGFAELCAGLTDRHFISINSNLTHGSIENFARQVAPTRVSFINAGLHLDERDRRSGHDVFRRNLEALLSRNFTTLVSLVATPAALRRFEEAVALLRPLDMFPIPKLFRGVLDGKHYPDAYSRDEKEIFKAASRAARAAYERLLAGREEGPSLDMLNDDRYLDGLPVYAGTLCHAGERFVHVVPNGDVFRCGGTDLLGNLLEGTLRLRQAPMPCASSHCYYFCNKYIAEPLVARAPPREKPRLRQKVLAALTRAGLPLRQTSHR